MNTRRDATTATAAPSTRRTGPWVIAFAAAAALLLVSAPRPAVASPNAASSELNPVPGIADPTPGEPAVSDLPDVDVALIERGDDWPAVLAEANLAYEFGVRERDSQPASARRMFELAATGFRRAIDEGGAESAALRYNLGNASARLDRHGRAVHQYLAALALRPDHADARRNLDIVRTRVRTRVEGAERGVIASDDAVAVLKPVLWAHRATPGEVKLWLFVLAAAAFWGVLGMRLYFAARGDEPKPPRRLAIVPFLVAALASASVADDAFGPRHTIAVVVDRDVVARTGPDESYGRQFTEALSPGVEMLVRETRDRWLRVTLANGRSAFVPDDAVALVEVR